MAPRISAVVCTYNRSEYLKRALRSLDEQSLPKSRFEIVVVDNGSIDATRQVVQNDFGHQPNLRYVYEAVNGVSSARNAGWRHSQGPLVAYLDDDAIAQPDWLEKILEVFAAASAEVGCVAGRVGPIWEAPRPAWVPASCLGYLSIIDWSSRPIVMSDGQWFLATNCAFRREALEAISGFDPRLGRTSRTLRSNEEILCKWALKQRGFSCLYHPDIVVSHHVPASRLTKRWFVWRAFWQGASQALVEIVQSSPPWRDRVRRGVTSLARLSAEELASLWRPSNDPYYFATRCRAFVRFGYVTSMWGLVR